MDNRITDELQSFMMDYAADPTPRDFAIAQHFYNLALEDVKKELGEMIIEAPISAEGHQRVYAYNTVMDFINNQKQ